MKIFLALLIPSLLCAPTLDLPVWWPVPKFAIRLGGWTGDASYYGAEFHGKIMRNGNRFDMHGHTAASNTLPLGTIARITRQDRPWRSVVDLDLSREAMRKLGGLTQGVVPVRIEVL